MNALLRSQAPCIVGLFEIGNAEWQFLVLLESCCGWNFKIKSRAELEHWRFSSW